MSENLKTYGVSLHEGRLGELPAPERDPGDLAVVLDRGNSVRVGTSEGWVGLASYATDANGNVRGVTLPDGTTRYSPYILAQSGIPMILPPSGGTLTAGGALSISSIGTVYGWCWIYLPASAVASATAGIYLANMTSTTAGTVYQNTYTGGEPTIPTAGSVLVGSGVAYTHSGSEITLVTIEVPANSIGATGCIRSRIVGSVLNSAVNKTHRVRFGNQLFGTAGATTAAAILASTYVQNAAVNKQIQAAGGTGGISVSGMASGASGAANAYQTIDTTQNVNLTFTVQVAAGTDYMTIDGFQVEVLPS